MNRRQSLTLAVKAMFAGLLFAFAFVLVRSLSGPPLSFAQSEVFDDVQVGESTLRRYQGERVWVTRLSAMQRRQAAELATLVIEPDAGCTASVTLCALSAKTQRDGIELVFSEQVPSQLLGQSLWYGGFVDPTTGAVYDRLGRAYKMTGTTLARKITVIPVR